MSRATHPIHYVAGEIINLAHDRTSVTLDSYIAIAAWDISIWVYYRLTTSVTCDRPLGSSAHRLHSRLGNRRGYCY